MLAWGCALPLPVQSPLQCGVKPIAVRRGAYCSIAEDHVLCFDIGTSSSKAALVRLRDAQVGRVGCASHETFTDYETGFVEQRVLDWEKSVFNAAKEAVELVPREETRNVVAIGVTGQMQTLLWEGGKYAILYKDSRGSQRKDVGKEWGGATGLLGKMLWVLENEDQIWTGKTNEKHPNWFFGAADWLVWKLCGKIESDPTTMSTTGLTRKLGREYKFEEMANFGVPRNWVDSVPELIDTPRISGFVSKAAAQFLGLPWTEGLAVVHGGGDAATTTIGSINHLGEGKPHLYVGTSGWIGGSVRHDSDHTSSQRGIEQKREPGISDNVVFNLGHPLPGHSIKLASMTCAGGCLEWVVKDFLKLKESIAESVLMAESAPLGAGGLLFLPYIGGERCPIIDEKARGAFVGLSASSDHAAVIRSVLEGVAFNYRACKAKLEGHALFLDEEVISNLAVVGGGMKSHVWIQILADVLACNLHIDVSGQVAGLRGAAVLSGFALSHKKTCFADLSSLSRKEAKAQVISPNVENVKRYEQLFGLWSQLYPALKKTFGDLSAFVTEKQ